MQASHELTLLSLLAAPKQLTGKVPPEIWGLYDGNSTFETLNLTGNLLSGVVPEELCSELRLDFHCSDRFCGCECPC